MKEKKDFGLSFYFDEMKERTPSETGQTKAAPAQIQTMSARLSTTAVLAVLKALKEAKDQKRPLMSLARATGMKIAECQDIVEQLKAEDLVGIAPDETGNDVIWLTQKGKELL